MVLICNTFMYIHCVYILQVYVDNAGCVGGKIEEDRGLKHIAPTMPALR